MTQDVNDVWPRITSHSQGDDNWGQTCPHVQALEIAKPTNAQLADADTLSDIEDMVTAASLQATAGAPTSALAAPRMFSRDAHVFEKWLLSSLEGARMLDERAAAMDRCDELLNFGGNTALVVSDDGIVCVVHWVGALCAKRWGRRVDLDSQNRIKFAVAATVPRESFLHNQIVHPNTGVRMLQQKGEKGALRPQLPAKMSRLKAIWQRALDGTAAKPVGACELCELPVLGDVDAMRCLLCDLVFHGSCSDRLVGWCERNRADVVLEVTSHLGWAPALRQQILNVDDVTCRMCCALMQ